MGDLALLLRVFSLMSELLIKILSVVLRSSLTMLDAVLNIPLDRIRIGDIIGQIKYSKANWIETDSFKSKVIEWNNSTAKDKHIGFGSTGI